MKKSLLALAVLGAFATAAQAQSSVTIYGDVDVAVSKVTDKTTAIGKGDSNRLGFKGVEDLGGGLKALFQLEMRFDPDTGMTENGGTRPLFQGESRVGLQGDFGMVRIGRGYTAMQQTNGAFEPWSYIPNRVGFASDIMVSAFNTDPLSASTGSKNRISNAVFYNSPVFAGGFQINGTIATKEANGSAAIVGTGTAALPQYAANAEGTVTPYSFSGTYTNGPVGAFISAERNAIESKYVGVGAYFMALPELKLMADYSRNDEGHTKLTNTKTKGWLVGANYTVGAGKILAGYGQKKPDGFETTKQFSLGYEHNLSKRTYLYVDGSNKKVGAAATTSTVNTFDFGIHHNF